jgi:hypothetical protein
VSFISQDDAGTPDLPTVEAAPPPISAPTGKKPKSRNQTSTFLGSDATPGPASGNSGGKTLLGQ